MIFKVFKQFIFGQNFFCTNLFRSYSLKVASPSFNYCLNSVQNNDYENFLSTLLLPKNLRTKGMVLRAFNVEIATIQDQVSENITGQMRFQFWEDTIDNLFEGKVPEHPVCQELAKVIETNKISKMYLKRLILSRRKTLTSSNFKQLKDAEEYSELTNSPIYYMLLELADIKNIDADHAASHLGMAQGLTNILRSTYRNSLKNEVVLPYEVLLKYNVSQEDILRNKVDKNVKDVFFEMASQINQHIEKMEELLKKISRKERLIYLPAVAVSSYLKHLRSANFNAFHPKLRQKDPFLSLKLARRRFLPLSYFW